MLFFAVYTKTSHGGDTPIWVWIAGSLLVVLSLLSMGMNAFERIKTLRLEQKERESYFQRREARDRAALDRLEKVTELASLLDLNQTQIERYHTIATDQADRSFNSAQKAMTAGMVLIASCFIAGFWVSTDVRWFIGALGTVGAALSAYLSKTFLYLYKESQAQLNRYFDQPVLNGYYLTAERLVDGISDDNKDATRRQIISQVLEASTLVGSNPTEPRPTKPKPQKSKRKTAVPAQAASGA
ncbi:hypothetical protein ABZX90_03135 [Streptomyces sp. NPDC002935]|uniref:TRADD-N-associated membrane domain-containing protein n=1 Tax=unclassified Streptomyces TaxID=2593676 RepID=UPI0033204B6A